ncbi:dihydrofolate reductase family protein [Risungbinella massiliensis]|uniref:dihydrofolate reductase family protein n=1 Tax=Risungbinella massiliensis TaxID=1329796 RepID=UPI0005CC4F40|nr:dihydrofolate reductase family protein [Risungbinella massiliensis]
MPSEVVLYIAQTLDGYIAREDGSIDFLESIEGEGDNGYSAFLESIDTVVMGRDTYDQVRSFNVPFPYQGLECYVFSRTRKGSDEYVTYVEGDVGEFIETLRAKRGKKIWLVGGAKLIEAFQGANSIDEYVVASLPYLLGSGIRLFQRKEPREERLELQKVERFGEVVLLHYRSKGLY